MLLDIPWPARLVEANRLAADGDVAIYLCGRNAGRLAGLSSRFSVERTFPSLEECLQSVTLNAVIIATPNFLHGEDAIRAIDLSLPVLLEKPVAHEIRVAREITMRATAADVPVHLNLPQPHRPSMRALKAAIGDGRFGHIRSIDVMMMRKAGIPGFGTWFTQKRYSGGGVLADHGPHMLDLALRLAGDYRAEPVSAEIWSDLGPGGKGSETGLRIGTFPMQRYSSTWKTGCCSISEPRPARSSLRLGLGIPRA